ncbi:uncharacterized protein LOC123657731 [Melitaea cinxia]|uniref:uncharacterized protein LOC123657731 n=1 Tax=Melitaea cinxia TaxID=113334 RepID=UPI001E271B72|nr:uncharacterized protein LOC123657731 [Melitaea cinxia]
MGQLQNPFQVHKADSGAIRFEIICTGMPDTSANPFIALISKECPHGDLYKITFEYDTGNICLTSPEERKIIEIPDFLIPLTTREFWLTWFNNEMYPPFLLPPLKYKHIEDGKLFWVKMVDNKLPPGAFIGGFENEPLYIARAMHNNSLCPGKYVPSKQCAYVPWGFREHEKRNFEILCGFNAIWIKCKENLLPENAFVAGASEINGEHLYIGRAMVNSNLIVGKVLLLYKTCYLPYEGREVERSSYEVLVKGNVKSHGISVKNKCLMNPTKAMQPCI